MARLLIVTATRGGSPFFGDTVASVVSLGAIARHVIVAPSDAFDILKAAAPSAEFVEEHEQRGLYSALNLGLAAAVDETWFTWINDDDFLCAEGVTKLLDACERQEADLGYGAVDMIDPLGEHLAPHPICRNHADLQALMGDGMMPFAQPGTILRRQSVDDVGGLDTSYRLAGDLDLFAKVIRGGCVASVQARVAAFRLHPGQLSKNEDVRFSETHRVRQQLKDSGIGSATSAKVRFRLANAANYWRRFRRFGFRRMEAVYRDI